MMAWESKSWINGFELLGMIDDNFMPNVVFVTAYDEYAIKAFEENTLDYLLKPVEKERLDKTVRKLKKALATGEKPVYSGQDIKKIPCILSSRIKLINIDEVDYVVLRGRSICNLSAGQVFYRSYAQGTSG